MKSVPPQKKNTLRTRKKQTKQKNKVLEALNDFFTAIDEDGSGEIDAEELTEAMHNMGDLSMTPEKAATLIASVDLSGSGTMGFTEFVHVMTDGELSKLADPDEVRESFI
jgi:Ca2+-binding EF-hand superfamily protein